MPQSDNRTSYLEVHLPKGGVETHALDRDTLVLGRSPGADICIDETEISRRHVVFRRLDNGRWVVKDCNSRNKTFLNGRPIRLHLLSDNDTLRVASIPVVFHDPSGQSSQAVQQTIYEDSSDTHLTPSLESANSDTAIMPTTAYSVLPYPASKAGSAVDDALVIDAASSAASLDRREPPAGRRAARTASEQSDAAKVRKVLRYRGTIFAVFILLALPGLAAVWWFVGPDYTATGKIRARSVVPRLVFSTEDNGIIPYYEYYAATQADLVRSPDVLERVLDLPDVQDTLWYRKNAGAAGRPPLDRFLRDLDIQYKPRTEVIEVTWTGPDAHGTALVVNAILGEYVKYVRENADRVRDLVYQKIEEESHSLRGEIQDRQKAAAEIRSEVGPAPDSKVVARRKELLDKMETQLRAINHDVVLAEWKQAELQAALTPRGPSATRPAGGDTAGFDEDEEWHGLNQTVKSLTVRLQSDREKYGDTDARVLDVREQLRFAEGQRRDRETQLRETRALLTRELSGKYKTRGEILTTLGDLAQQIQVLKFRRELLLENLRKQMVELEQISNSTLWLAQEKDAIQHLKDLYASLRNRLDQKGLERNAPDTIEVLAKAFVPSRPTADRRKKLSLAVLLAALVAGVGVAGLRGRADLRVYEAEDLQGLLEGPLLGRLPLVPARRTLTARENALLSESIRVVRTALLARLNTRPGAAVAVTSAEPGAGKTSLAVMLARSLAQLGRKVLLVDADWRNPSIAGCFRIDRGPGLAGALAVPGTREITVQTDSPLLSVLPAGEFPKGPNFELLADGVFRACLQRWQTEYDLILIDTPAVLPVADTRLLAGALDGVVMVVKEKHSRSRDILKALDGLDTCGANLLGLVYIGADNSPDQVYKLT